MDRLNLNISTSNKSRRVLTICVPVLNEKENILPLYERLNLLSYTMESKCDFEFIFTDNDSTDGTWEILEALGKSDKRVHAYRFATNVGFQNSILFNISQATGDAVVQIDADLQDPPEIIEKFYDLWLEGNLIVYGIRTSRKESWLMNSTRRLGYHAINVLSEHPIPTNAGDFRLLDRKVVEALKSTKTPNPYLRGIVSRFGFKQIGVEYARSERTLGESKFNLTQVIRLGFNALSNHSNAPIRIGMFIGLSSLSTCILSAIFYVILKIRNPDLPVGFITVYVLILFGIAINSLMLSLVLNYLNRIYLMIRGEPLVIVIGTIN